MEMNIKPATNCARLKIDHHQKNYYVPNQACVQNEITNNKIKKGKRKEKRNGEEDYEEEDEL